MDAALQKKNSQTHAIQPLMTGVAECKRIIIVMYFVSAGNTFLGNVILFVNPKNQVTPVYDIEK